MDKRILSEIWIYPVKSLGGIRLPTAQVLEKGLRYDRRWMLVNEKNEFLSQRAYPSMALFKMKTDPGGFFVTHGNDSILLPTEMPTSTQTIQAQIWDDHVDVLEMPIEYNKWFSSRLDINCKLVGFPEGSPRPAEIDHNVGAAHVSLADGYPLLIIGTSSLYDLNARLEIPLPMNRFRPNLVFEGGVPYEEDGWRNFTVGKNRFVGVRPCARCVIPTVDQETGIKGKEPLLTLSRYRKRDENIYFGQNIIAIDHSEVNEGDEITIE